MVRGPISDLGFRIADLARHRAWSKKLEVRIQNSVGTTLDLISFMISGFYPMLYALCPMLISTA